MAVKLRAVGGGGGGAEKTSDAVKEEVRRLVDLAAANQLGTLVTAYTTQAGESFTFRDGTMADNAYLTMCLYAGLVDDINDGRGPV